MTMMFTAFHCQGPSAGERGTAVTMEDRGQGATVQLGIGGECPCLSIYLYRPAEAFALAQAFARAGEVLEARAAVSRAHEVPGESWKDVPLPLDHDHVAGEVELCDCGKPAVHLAAPMGSDDWSCRVPRPGCIHQSDVLCTSLGCRDERCPSF
jgi:hypothetical protein